MTVSAHILTDIPKIEFTRQSFEASDCWEGVKFTFGLDLPLKYDVLIIYNCNKWTIKSKLPFNRLAYVSAEPEWSLNHSPRFLNQFRYVVISGDHNLKTTRLKESIPIPWFVGLKFIAPHVPDPKKSLGIEQIIDWDVPKKNNQISIVTSKITDGKHHHLRLRFIEYLKNKIPDHIHLYGWSFNQVPDKKDAIFPHKYHLALENNIDTWGWTEKLADPLLCYSLPFYYGSSNAEREIPNKAFIRIDPTNPEEALRIMMVAIESDAWSNRINAIKEARQKILYQYNIMAVFARIAKILLEEPPQGRNVIIRSEVSLPPSKHSNHSWRKFIGRRIKQLYDPHFEVRKHQNPFEVNFQNDRLKKFK